MRSRTMSVIIGVTTFVVVIAAWKAYVSWADVSKFLLPPPSRSEPRPSSSSRSRQPGSTRG